MQCTASTVLQLFSICFFFSFQRSPYKLQNTAAEIESKYKVKTKIVDVDFTDSDKEYIPKVEKEIAGLDIGVLVGNCVLSPKEAPPPPNHSLPFYCR